MHSNRPASLVETRIAYFNQLSGHAPARPPRSALPVPVQLNNRGGAPRPAPAVTCRDPARATAADHAAWRAEWQRTVLDTLGLRAAEACGSTAPAPAAATMEGASLLPPSVAWAAGRQRIAEVASGRFKVQPALDATPMILSWEAMQCPDTLPRAVPQPRVGDMDAWQVSNEFVLRQPRQWPPG